MGSVPDCSDASDLVLSPDVPNFAGITGFGTEKEDPHFDKPLPAPMPFTKPTNIQPTVTVTLMIPAVQPPYFSTSTQANAAWMSTAPHEPIPAPSAPRETTETCTSTAPPQSRFAPTPTSADPMMKGNPEPKRPRMHEPVIIGVAILKKAIKYQLAHGSRRLVETGFNTPDEWRRELVVDGKVYMLYRYLQMLTKANVIRAVVSPVGLLDRDDSSEASLAYSTNGTPIMLTVPADMSGPDLHL
ncbi:MAG: hypothetical protein Q9166_003877 [cf. Caloplaca sp. 2 TL-2023]